MKSKEDLVKWLENRIAGYKAYSKNSANAAIYNALTSELETVLITQVQPAQFQTPWIKSSDRLPEEGGRYLCWVSEVNDLGISHFFWNCSYDATENTWRDNFISYNVTHWQEITPPKD